MAIIALLVPGLAAHAATNGTVTQPSGANLDVTPPGAEAISLIEHFPYTNLITWELFVQTPQCVSQLGMGSRVCRNGPTDGQACMTHADCGGLTYVRGTAELFDEDGNPMSQASFTPARFDEVVRFWGGGINYVPLGEVGFCNVDGSILCAVAGGPDPDQCDPNGTLGNALCDPRPSAGYAPPGGSIGIPFPLEKIGHNVVPASADMSLCFSELGNTSISCPAPVSVTNVVLGEYHARESYIFPLEDPNSVTCVDGNGNPSGATPLLFTGAGGGHEINSNHRFARNQRYAYDIGVRCGSADRKNLSQTNDDWYIYLQPVVAQAAGSVVLFEAGHPENTSPPDNIFAGFCDSRRCDGMTPDTCVPDPDPTLAIIPGSGNQLVLVHDSGERTNYTHMTTGSNDAFPCGTSVNQGDPIGQVGNVGNSSAPHIHISTLTSDGPEDQKIGIDTSNWPNYWTNVMFASADTMAPNPNLPPQSYTPRRQLDVGIPTRPNDLSWEILAAPAPLPRNPALGGVNESEPNDVLAQHNSLNLPAAVMGVLESGDVGDLAVRGDAIEDIYRVDLSSYDELRIDLDASASGENLDVYALTEDLRVVNPTHEGTSPTGIERMCPNLDAGVYYLMVSNVDLTTSQAASYGMTVVSDRQTIQVSIEGGAPSVEVDGDCEARVDFTIALHDNCCLDDSLDLGIVPTIVGGGATLGSPVVDSVQVQSETDILVSGHVAISDLTSCPAELRIDASAQDCAGNRVDTAVDGGEDRIDVLDTMPPVVTSSVANSRPWPPTHDLIDVGFARGAEDNCDVQVAQTLDTEVWSDESETAVVGNGPFAPDAKDPNGALRLRAERRGSTDGRVYLMTTDAVDACGNRAFACSAAGVAQSEATAAALSLDAQEADALAVCGATDGAPPGAFEQHGLATEVGSKQ